MCCLYVLCNNVFRGISDFKCCVKLNQTFNINLTKRSGQSTFDRTTGGLINNFLAPLPGPLFSVIHMLHSWRKQEQPFHLKLFALILKL